jgi:hypothetical protein
VLGADDQPALLLVTAEKRGGPFGELSEEPSRILWTVSAPIAGTADGSRTAPMEATRAVVGWWCRDRWRRSERTVGDDDPRHNDGAAIGVLGINRDGDYVRSNHPSVPNDCGGDLFIRLYHKTLLKHVGCGERAVDVS